MSASAGCGPKQEAPSIPASKGSAAVGYQEVMAASTLDGKRLAPDDRAVAMVVFATWCGYCRKELAELAELREEFPELRIIGLNAYEDYKSFSDRDRLRDFLDSEAPWLTEVVHAGEDLRNAFGGIPKIPTLFVYSATGEVIAEYRRERRPKPSRDELRTALRQAMQH